MFNTAKNKMKLTLYLSAEECFFLKESRKKQEAIVNTVLVAINYILISEGKSTLLTVYYSHKYLLMFTNNVCRQKIENT